VPTTRAGSSPTQRIRDERSADHDLQCRRGQPAGRVTADEGADDRGRQHPADESPIDAAGADVPDRAGCRRDAGDGEIRAADGGRARAREQQDRQPDVAEHEPQEAARERDDEAPRADCCEGECVHSLEYGP
jgi:hypothetical protein